MAIRIGNNIASLMAQRKLSQNSDQLNEVMGKLASGQRINRASDDPAGLALSTELRANSRVFTQGIRNVNDGISLLTVAQGALTELASVTQRQIELAEQAANGTLSVKQRQALDKENAELIKEFNRIVESTKFNGMSLLDGSLISGLRIQAGYGTDGSYSGAIGDMLARVVGTGSFTAGTTIGNGGATGVYDLKSGDFNGDGILDVAGGSWTSGTWVSFGNGDGTFKAAITSPGLAQTAQIEVADLNGDGKDDIVSIADFRLSVLISNGDGTFKLQNSFPPDSFFAHDTLSVADFTGDGIADILTYDPGVGRLNIYSGNGNGTFKAAIQNTYSIDPVGIATGDINGDGKADILASTSSGTVLLTSNGNGTFSNATVISVSGRDSALADIDGDGNLDILSTQTAGANLVVKLGNGNGTFKAASTYSFGVGGLTLTFQDLKTGDLNGDGIPDILLVTRDGGTSAGTAQIMLGNADGTFKARTTFGPLIDSLSGVIGDFDRDGVNDVIVATAWDRVTFFDANTTRSTLIARQDLTTQANARTALETNKAQLDRITLELGAVGALQSRSSIAVNNLSASRVVIDEAASRIEDVDVAEAAAEMIRLQILQNAGTSILAQANLVAKLVLELL